MELLFEDTGNGNFQMTWPQGPPHLMLSKNGRAAFGFFYPIDFFPSIDTDFDHWIEDPLYYMENTPFMTCKQYTPA